jgi:hypothetical protein
MSSFGVSFGVRGVRRVVVTAVAISLLTGLLSSPPVRSQAAPRGGAVLALTESQAISQAAVSGKRVEIPARTTETSRTFANPGGTLTTELNAAPVRARKGGKWVALDTTLEFAPDGSVRPKAAADLTLSGGGTGQLAKLVTEEGSLGMGAPWSLPRPTLSGSTSTYAEVLPGVDLVAEATREGFTYNLVVKTRAAAQNPALDSVRFPITKNGLTSHQGEQGRAEFLDKSGRLVLIVGEPLMWDSAGPATNKTAARSSAAAVAGGPVGGPHVAEMGFHQDDDALTFIPDSTMLDSAETVFPVVLDPVVKRQTRNAWTAVWQLYPTQSFFKTSHELGVGYEGFEQHKIVRSFWQFDVAPFLGKKVISADFRVYEVHSASCAARSVTVTRTGPISAATNWNNQPGGLTDVATRSFAHGYTQSCPNAAEEFDVTSSVGYTIGSGGRTLTFRLRASDETDEIAWKQFDPTFGQLDVTYISQPKVPALVAVADPAVGCKPSTAPAYIGDLTPKLQAQVLMSTTETSARLSAQWEVYNSAGALVVTRTSGTGAPGTLMTNILATNLADQTIFHFRARTLYPYTGGTLASAWSGWCYFHTDSTIPPPPTISVQYGGLKVDDCGTSLSCPDSTPYGAAVNYTFKAGAADVVKHLYRFQNSLGAGESAGNTSTKAIVPPEEGWNTIYVKSQDAAGHSSQEVEYTINIHVQSGPIGSWAFDDPTGATTTAADAASPAHPLTVAGAAVIDDVGRDGHSLQFDGVDDYASNAATVVDTSKSFTVSAWARVTNTTREGVVAAATGVHGSGFELYFSNNHWVFLRMATDVPAPALVRATSDDVALWGVWTHLTGVYDTVNKRMLLYVNGKLQTAGNVAYTYTAWKATGPFSVGRGRYNDAVAAPFTGMIDSVQLWQRALRPVDIAKVASFVDLEDPDGGQVAGLVARWPFDNAYNSADQVWRTSETVYAANMELRGIADPSTSIVLDEDRGSVLSLGGAQGAAVTLPRPVVDAGGSFSVAVWVKLADTSKKTVIVRQGSTTADSWRLEFEPTSSETGQWVFARGISGSSTETKVVSATDLEYPKDDWHLLVATFDAIAAPDAASNPAGKIALAVDRIRADELDFSASIRTGSTQVGIGRGGEQLAGLVDDLRIYAGVVSDERVCQDFPEVGNCGTDG